MGKRNSKKSSSKPKPDTAPIRGLLLLCLTFGLFLSLVSVAVGQEAKNWLGVVGFSIGRFLHAAIGLGSYLSALAFLWIGWRFLFSKPINHPALKSLYATLCVTSLCILLCLVEDQFPIFGAPLKRFFYPHAPRNHLGGIFFYFFYRELPLFNLFHIFNTVGIALIFGGTLLASIAFLTKTTPAQWLRFLGSWIKKFFTIPPALPKETDAGEIPVQTGEESNPDTMRFVKLRIPENAQPQTQPVQVKAQQDLLAIRPEKLLTSRPSLSQKERTDRKKEGVEEHSPSSAPVFEGKRKTQEEPFSKKRTTSLKAIGSSSRAGDFGDYTVPSVSLLSDAKKVDHSSLKQDLRRQAEVLEETLLSFGIEAKVGQINCGPTITSFEVHPAIGVKVQKIKTLEDDIALNMEAKSIRIIAPIPGKAAVGIEVPNPTPQEVGFKEMLATYQQSNRKMHIPVLLGKAVNGDYVTSDLTKMPHCIIAGATGSGKSVCINTIIMSIVMNARPDEIKLILVDPKKVELTLYSRLPHMLAPVITEPQGACAALNWLVKEMENRYEILKQLGVRNIEGFNGRKINKEWEQSLDREIPIRLPYIVLIIDELADLMMVSTNDIETPIARIAQMARAIGIHMILATQRPSREVITGLIKANFPSRISFKVASRVNSQIVLDDVGAEALLGNGDMLFLPPGSSTLIRAQGALIRDQDITDVIRYVETLASPNYEIASFDEMGKEGKEFASSSEPVGDSLYEQAKLIVLSSGNASTTFLQRKLKIGYARAASLIDELHLNSVIGPAEGSKPRKVLTPMSSFSPPPMDQSGEIGDELGPV